MLKMMVTASFHGAENRKEIEYLCSLVRKSGFEDICFIRDVENYEHIFDNPKDLMARALEEIKKCDYLLIDMTDKPTGRAIEARMAYTLRKMVVVIMKKGTVIKDTTRGIADAVIEYENLEDIVLKLRDYLGIDA